MSDIRNATIAIQVVGNALQEITKIIGAFKQLVQMAKNPIVIKVAVDSESLKRSNEVIEKALQATRTAEVPVELGEEKKKAEEIEVPSIPPQEVPVRPRLTETPSLPPLYLPIQYSGKIPLAKTTKIPPSEFVSTGIIPLPERRIAPLSEKELAPLLDSTQFERSASIKVNAVTKLTGNTGLFRSALNALGGVMGSIIGQFRDIRGERGYAEAMDEAKEKTDDMADSASKLTLRVKTLGQALRAERFATTTIFTSLASMYLFTKLPEAAMNYDQMKREFIARAREKGWGEDIIEELTASKPAVKGISRYEHLEALSTVGWYEREPEKLLPQITNMEKFYAAYKETLRTQSGIGSFSELMSAIHSGNYEVLRPVLGTSIITEIQAIPEAYREIMQEYIKEGMPADIAEQRVKELAAIDAINKKLQDTTDLEKRIADNSRMSWQDFYAAVLDVGIVIGDTILPAMMTLADWARKLADFISSHKILATIIGWALVLGLVAAIIGLIVSIIMSAVGGLGIMASLLAGIGLGVPEIAAAFAAILGVIVLLPPILEKIGSKLGWIADLFKGIDVNKLLVGDIGQLGVVADNIKEMITSRIKISIGEGPLGVFKGFDLGKLLSGDLGQIRTILSNIGNALKGEYISFMGSRITDAIFSIPDAIVGSIKYTLHDLFDPVINAINMLSGIASGIYDKLVSIWGEIVRIVDKIKDFGIKNVPGVAKAESIVNTIKEKSFGFLSALPFKTMLTAQVAGPEQRDIGDIKNQIKIVTNAVAGPVMGNLVDRFPFLITIINLAYEIILKIYELLRRLLDWINEKLEWIHGLISKIWDWVSGFKDWLAGILSKIPGVGSLFESEAEKELKEKYGFVGWGTEENEGMAGFQTYGIDYGKVPPELSGELARLISEYSGGSTVLAGGQYKKFIEEHPEMAKYLKPYFTKYYTPYEATLPIERGGLGVPPDLLDKAKNEKPPAPVNIPSPGEIVEGAKEGLEEQTKESAQKTEEGLKNKSTAMGAADWSIFSPLKYAYSAGKGALSKFDVGSTFERGGMFAGIVHAPEEIIPQAVARRGPGPISSAINTLQNIIEQNRREISRAEKYDIGVSFNRTGLFKGIVHAPEEIIPQAVAKKGPGPISNALSMLHKFSLNQVNSRSSSIINTAMQRSHISLEKMISENVKREETYSMPTYNVNLSVNVDNPVIDSRERIEELTTELRHRVERMIRDVIHREMRYYTRA